MNLKAGAGNKNIRFGVAGWSYPDWEGIVYPRPKPKGFEPLELIASLVDAVEINSSFYSPPSPNSARKWLRVIKPFPEFRFSAKLWQKFTHEKGAWTKEDVKIFKQGLGPLFESGLLLCLLAQFPWSFRNNKADFERLIKIRDEFKEFPLVVEIRHSSWQNQDFFNWLAQTQTGFANIDQPIFGDSLPPTELASSKIGYVRLHGRNHENWFKKDAEPWERYDYLYEEKEFSDWLPRIKTVSQNTEQMLVIANNHFQGKGVASTLMLKAMWSRKKQKAPKTLIDKYPLLKEFCEPREAQRDLF